MGKWPNCVIQHDSCDFDSNCGFTCEQVFWRELASDSSAVYSTEFYEDFMNMCTRYYFPNGCDSSSGSVCPSSEFNWNEVNSGFVEAFPVFFAIFGVYCIVKVFNFALK